MALVYANVIGSSGPDIIVLHGFLGMGDNWKSHARQWHTLGYRVHLIDQRNHGRSFWSSEFNYTVMSDDLFAYVEQQQLKDFVLVGHSMGGKTAMYFDCSHPELVQRLVVVDIAPKAYPPHHQDILDSLALLHRTKLSSRQQADLILEPQLPNVGLRQFLLKNLYRATPDRLALRLNFKVLKNASSAVGAALPEGFNFDKPCLFLAGALSNYILPEDHQNIKEQFPKAEFEVISNAGHWLHAENPKAFQEVMHQWLVSEK